VSSHDNFVIKYLGLGVNSLTSEQELPLKLARKCVDIFGTSVIQEDQIHHHVDFGCEDEALDLQAGKEFAFMLSHQGKLYFSGMFYLMFSLLLS
jgi:E3 ubiquitin-protein ligase MYCBP2